MASARSSLCSAWLTLTQPLSLSYKITSQADLPDFLIPARALTQAAGASLSPHTLLTCDYLMIIEYFLLSKTVNSKRTGTMWFPPPATLFPTMPGT